MEFLSISEIKTGSRFRKDLGDIASLAKSIEEIGLLHPIVVTPEGKLIAGGRRLKACKALGWDTVPVHRVYLQDITKGEYHENTARKDFLPSEAVAIQKALLPIESQAARERQGTRTDLQPPAKLAGGWRGQTRDKVASYIGIGRTTLGKATKVVEAAEREPEKFSNLVEFMDKTGKVDGAYKKLKQAEKRDFPAMELPVGEYNVILADPPWRLKSVQHLKEEGELTKSLKDIGLIIRAVQQDIIEEETDNIKNELFNKFRDDILRTATKGLPEWYKDKLLGRVL